MFGEEKLCHQIALVSLGYYDKIPQIGWLKKQMFISHNSGNWEVQDRGTGRFSFSEGSPQALEKVTPSTEEEKALVSPPLARTLTPSWGPHPHDIT